MLTPLDHALAFPPGAAGLRTLRFEAVYAAPESAGRLEFRDTNFNGRIGWKEVVLTSPRPRQRWILFGPVDERQPRARRVPEGPPEQPARGHDRDRNRPARRRPGKGAAARVARRAVRPCGGPGDRRRRLREPHRTRRPRRRRDPDLARARVLLGLGSRALARAREGDRHRVPRRPAREAPPRGRARSDRHRDAHDRRLHARLRDARRSRSSSSPSSSTRGSGSSPGSS